MRRRVVVVGGGISGLSAALRLSQCDPAVDVLLLESSGRVGGVLETTRRDGFLLEAAADNFLSSPPAAVDLCEQVGLRDSLLGADPSRRQAFVVRRGRLQPIPPGFLVMAPSRIWPVLTSPVLSWRGKLRLALEYFLPPRRGEEDESLASFVSRRFGREMFERLVQPLVGGIYTADPECLSIEATMPRFRQLERKHGSLTRAMLRNRRGAQRDGSVGAARYGQFAAPRLGMSSLVQALADQLPQRAVRLHSPLEGVAPLAGGRWLLLVGGRSPASLETDGLILATPAYRTARLLEDVDVTAATELNRIEYASCAVVSLGYRREQIQHPLNGFGFVVPLLEQRTILSCSFSSVKYEGRAPKDSALMRVFLGGACQGQLLQLHREQLVQLAEREIADLLRIRGEPVLRHIHRQRRAMPQYHVGHCQRMALVKEQLRRFPTLALAGNAYGGVGIPGCIESGQAAAQEVLAQLKSPASRSPARAS